MASAKPLGFYRKLWQDYLSGGGSPPLEFTRLSEVEQFMNAGVESLREAGRLRGEAQTEAARQMLVELGKFHVQIGDYSTWKRLETKYRERIAELEGELDAARDESAGAATKLAALQAAQAEWERDRQMLNEQLVDAGNRLGAANARADAAEQAQTGAVADLQAQLAAAREREAALQADIEKLKQALSEAEEVAGQIVELQGEIDELTSAHAAELARLREEHAAKLREAEQAAATNEELAALRRQLADAAAEHEAALQAERDRAAAEAAQASASRAGSDAAHAEELAQLKAEWEEKLAAAMAEREAADAAHAEEIARLQAEREAADAAHGEEIAQLKSAHDRELAELRAAHEAELAALRQERDAALAAVDKARQDADAELKAELASTKESAAAQVAGMQAQLDAADKAKADELAAQQTAHDAAVSALESAHAEAMAQLKRDFADERDALMRRIAELEAEVTRLTEERKDLKVRVAFAEAEMEKARDALTGAGHAGSVRSREEAKARVVEGVDHDRAAVTLFKVWGFPDSLTKADKLTTASVLREAVDKLNSRVPGLRPDSRAKLGERAEKMLRDAKPQIDRYSALRARHEGHPLTPAELREIVELHSRLQALSESLPLLVELIDRLGADDADAG
jgi:hypothetical protein